MTRIPNVFHFVFGLREKPEPLHLMHFLCLVSCLEVNRPEAVHFHYHHEPTGPWWERIKPRLVLRRLDPDAAIAAFAYPDPAMAKYRYAHLADFARLQILKAEGGIYADLDTLFLRPVPPALFEADFVLGRERAPKGAEGSLCNAWIGSAPGAEFGRVWLEQSLAAFDGSWSAHSTLLPWRLAQRMPQAIRIEPEERFYALDWTRRHLADLFLRSVALPDTALSLHLWSHLWFARKRRDFLHFHGEALTPDYVAHADTTYARAARRFLPDDVPTSELDYARQARQLILAYPVEHVLSKVFR